MGPHRRPLFGLLVGLSAAFLALAGCSAPRADPSVETAVRPVEPPAAALESQVEPPLERVRCFAGEQRVRLATGEAQPGAETVIRRTLDPAASTIVEEVLRIDPLPRVPPRVYKIVSEVEGDRFELVESGGAYVGSGTLRGVSWRWTGWSSEYALTSGIRVESESEIDDGGNLVTRQQVYGPDGREVMTIEQTAAPVPLKECDRRIREVAAPAPSSGG